MVSHHIRNDISTCNGLSGISIKKLKTVMCTLVPYIRHSRWICKEDYGGLSNALTLFLSEDAVSIYINTAKNDRILNEWWICNGLEGKVQTEPG